MRANGTNYFRLLLLSSIYLLGILGIVACGGGSEESLATPPGEYLVLASGNSGKLSVYRIDETLGELRAYSESDGVVWPTGFGGSADMTTNIDLLFLSDPINRRIFVYATDRLYNGPELIQTLASVCGAPQLYASSSRPYVYTAGGRACPLEIYAIGEDSQVNFINSLAPVAPLSWAGVKMHPSGNFLYVFLVCASPHCSPQDISLNVLRIDVATGGLSFLSSVATGLPISSTLAFNPSGTIAYIFGSVNSVLQTYSVDTNSGELTLQDSTNADGSYPFIIADPIGNFLFTASAVDNIVSSYSIDEITGALSFVSNTNLPGNVTNGCVNQSGEYLYLLFGDSGEIAGLSIDAATGATSLQGLTLVDSDFRGVTSCISRS